MDTGAGVSAARLLSGYQTASPTQWAVADVCEWLLSRGHRGEIVRVFESHSIDGQRLITLTNATLRDRLKVMNLADRQRLLSDIKLLTNAESPRKMDSGPVLNVVGSASYTVAQGYGAPSVVSVDQSVHTPVLTDYGQDGLKAAGKYVTLTMLPRTVVSERNMFPVMRPALFGAIVCLFIGSLTGLILSITIEALEEYDFIRYASIGMAVISSVAIYGWDYVSQKITYTASPEQFSIQGNSFFFPTGRYIPTDEIESVCTICDRKPKVAYIRNEYQRVGVRASIVLKSGAGSRSSLWPVSRQILLPLPFTDVDQVYTVCERVSRIIQAPFVPADSINISPGINYAQKEPFS